ncbi:hypothetical protein FEM48_Zijuj03G0171000 [Ziziphus jujuba var. spinosa]|uniref:protein-serine/threonine phosphatase n=1 Tax=Ziziphus jujuba var. spinosa TaxID=714518 RepID=A0A978VRJ9_ZIZJJ|nr:hypothetical protein FEM48_Zijuj03G0171000 [Ziziphus jujuba var. spinosa]
MVITGKETEENTEDWDGARLVGKVKHSALHSTAQDKTQPKILLSCLTLQYRMSRGTFSINSEFPPVTVSEIRILHLPEPDQIVSVGVFDPIRLFSELNLEQSESEIFICKISGTESQVAPLRWMMVDTSATGKRGPIIDVLPEKDDDGGYASGGWKSEDGKLSCGYSSFRGKRATMEDFYDIKTSKIDGQTVCLFGIFDGHGGSRAAEYLKEHLFENLMKHPQFMMDTKLAISESYKQTDSDFLDTERDTYRDDGSTASTAVLVGNHLYVANVGDSRTIISKAGKAIPLSEDHKPNRSDERKRIESAGGVVMWAGTWRVGGVLAMSRAFGNRMLKQFVVAEPEIQDAVSLARTEEETEAAARKLTEVAFTRGSADNITCIVVRFHHDKAAPAGSSPQHD